MSNEIATISTLMAIRLNKQMYPRLRDIHPEQAIAELATIVGSAFMYSGRKGSAEDIAYISGNLYSELMQDADGLGMQVVTLEEIRRAIKKAVLRQSGEMYGINVASLYGVVADYCKGEGHRVCEEIGRMNAAEKLKALASGEVGQYIEATATKLIKQ